MKESNILAGNVSNNFLGGKVLINIKGQFMKDSISLQKMLAQYACRGSFANLKGLPMKESNILSGKVANIFFRGEVMLNIKWKSMIESGIPAVNVGNNFLKKGILLEI